ncbi:hypothetical protein Tco_1022777 [Tanacetum coccineum]
MSQNRSTRARENSAQPHVVLTNDDLLTEILIRLPIVCIHLFTTVSKQWLRILTSLVFTINHSKIPNLDPLAGIFVNHNRNLFECDFVSLDSKLESRKSAIVNSFTLGSTMEAYNSFGGSIGSDDPMLVLIDIPGMLHLEGRLFQSRGCLLLVCRDDIGSRESLFKCDLVSLDSRLDSRKSTLDNSFGSAEEVDHVRILQSCNGLLLCNDVFHWLETDNRKLKHYKLDIEDHDHLIITTIGISHGLHRGRNFLDSFGSSSDDLILMLIEIPQMLHLEGKFFESYGCLLLVCRDVISSREFTIYEMMKGCFVWSVRYLFNSEELMNPFPEGWSIRSTVWSISLGEREEDTFLVINLSGQVVKYNLISKTINEIFDIGSNQMDDDDVEFIRPFSVDSNVYEFILSFACV